MPLPKTGFSKTMIIVSIAMTVWLLESTAYATEESNNPFLIEMIRYSQDLEQRILEQGRPLTVMESMLAEQADVRHPELVRVLVLPSVPEPKSAVLREKLQQLGILRLIARAKGSAKGYGIVLTTSGAKSPGVIAHELVHVGQYERFDGIEGLMRYHLPDLEANGYRDSELEGEAYRRALEIISNARM
jgi:hypothetical protein